MCTKQSVENEEHFLTECPSYNQERINFLDNMRQYSGIDTKIMDLNLIKNIMGTKDLTILNKFGRYIRSCVEKRKRQTSQIDPLKN